MGTDKILKNGCMGCLLTFGALFLLFFAITWFMMDSSTKTDNTPRHFEVLTKKGMVQLYMGMPKDSLILVVGAPDDIKSHSSYDKTIVEELGYKVKDDTFCDLTFTFENGKLEEYRQY
jgi:hypothetical protein